eukprot:125071-Prymnesium_polylepis.1
MPIRRLFAPTFCGLKKRVRMAGTAASSAIASYGIKPSTRCQMGSWPLRAGAFFPPQKVFRNHSRSQRAGNPCRCQVGGSRSPCEAAQSTRPRKATKSPCAPDPIRAAHEDLPHCVRATHLDVHLGALTASP